jgi:hypothetical protein
VKLDWMGDVKKTHERFTFTPTSELNLRAPKLEPEPPTTSAVVLFQEEEEGGDPIKLLIKKVMYAEGDHIALHDECAIYLKDALQVL